MRLICSECMFANPDLIKDYKEQITPLESYLGDLYRRIDQTRPQREFLKTNQPEEIKFIKGEGGKQLLLDYDEISNNAKEKLVDILTVHKNKINEMFDHIIEIYTQKVNKAVLQIENNFKFLESELNNRYFCTTQINRIESKEDLVRELELAHQTEKFLEEIETQCKKEYLDQDHVDSYCQLLVRKFSQQCDSSIEFNRDDLTLIERLNTLLDGTRDLLKNVKLWVDSSCLKNIEAKDISLGINFESFKRAVSQDGFSGFLDFDTNYKPTFRLVNNIMSPPDTRFTCLTSIGGQYLVGGCQDGRLIFYQAEEGNTLGQTKAHTSRVSTICWMKDRMDNVLVCSGSEDHESSIVLTNVKSTKKVAEYKLGHAGGITALLGLPNKRNLVSGGHDGVLCLWDILKPELSFLQREVGHRITVSCIKYYEKEDMLISGGKDAKISLWKLHRSTDKWGEYVSRLDFFQSFARPHPIFNIIPRQTFAGSQIFVVENVGLKVEIINLEKMAVEHIVQQPYPDDNFVLLEHVYLEGRNDFALVPTVTPGDEVMTQGPTASQGQDDSSQTMKVISEICNPRVQLVHLNKNYLRLAKISRSSTGTNFISISDIITKAHLETSSKHSAKILPKQA